MRPLRLGQVKVVIKAVILRVWVEKCLNCGKLKEHATLRCIWINDSSFAGDGSSFRIKDGKFKRMVSEVYWPS